MATRGRPSSHPSGIGRTDCNGYHQIYDKGKQRLAHTVIWEKAFGPVPEGMQLHHIDGNKQNNELANLALVTPMEHRRLHLDTYVVVELKWMKDCKDCHGRFPIDREHWYFTRGSTNSKRCKDCHRKQVYARQKRAALQPVMD